LHPRHGGLGAGLDAGQHRGKSTRVLQVPLLRSGARALHPLQVGAGAEVPAVACQHDDAHLGIGLQCGEGRVQFADHGLVEGVVDGRARHRHLGDARGAPRDGQGLECGHQ
jgi:hypothetical protein